MIHYFYFLILVLLPSLGCSQATGIGGGIDPALTNCQPGVAMIVVGDGFLQTRCGCILPTEAPGTVFVSPTPLTCHLENRNTQVHFNFFGTTLTHQIVSVGSPSFVPSPLIDPRADNRIWSYVVPLTQGQVSYKFQDIISGMMGEIFVP